MGDIVHTLPAVAALRRAFSEATIGWVVEDRWSELLCAQEAPRIGPRSSERPLVDAVHVVDTLAWRSALLAAKTRRQALAALHAIRDAHYQVAIDFQGAIKSAMLMQWTHTPKRIGFERPRERAARLFYTRAVSPRGRHISEQNLALAGAVMPEPLSAREFLLPCDPAAEAWCDTELRRRGVAAFAIINPGAGWGAKCWPAERYAEVASALAVDGFSSLINVGPAEEPLGRAVEAASGGAAAVITCSVGQMIALARRARLLIGGDTGPLHLAAALRVPVVGIYGPTDPARNGPVGAPNVVLRHPSSETSHSHRAEVEPGLLSITAAEVIDAARHLLCGGLA